MRSERTAALEVRGFYGVPELARAINVSPDKVRRILRGANVEMMRCGRNLVVPLGEIEEKIPPLWKALQAVERLRRSHQGADGE